MTPETEIQSDNSDNGVGASFIGPTASSPLTADINPNLTVGDIGIGQTLINPTNPTVYDPSNPGIGQTLVNSNSPTPDTTTTSSTTPSSTTTTTTSTTTLPTYNYSSGGGGGGIEPFTYKRIPTASTASASSYSKYLIVIAAAIGVYYLYKHYKKRGEK